MAVSQEFKEELTSVIDYLRSCDENVSTAEISDRLGLVLSDYTLEDLFIVDDPENAIACGEVVQHLANQHRIEIYDGNITPGTTTLRPA